VATKAWHCYFDEPPHSRAEWIGARLTAKLLESLHGHNYRVGVTLSGDLDHHSLVYDFIALKRDMESLLSELDHRMLLPTLNPELDVTTVKGGEVEARHATSRYVFPESDVALLQIEVEETPGQSAFFVRTLGDC